MKPTAYQLKGTGLTMETAQCLVDCAIRLLQAGEQTAQDFSRDGRYVEVVNTGANYSIGFINGPYFQATYQTPRGKKQQADFILVGYCPEDWNEQKLPTKH